MLLSDMTDLVRNGVDLIPHVSTIALSDRDCFYVILDEERFLVTVEEA